MGLKKKGAGGGKGGTFQQRKGNKPDLFTCTKKRNLEAQRGSLDPQL